MLQFVNDFDGQHTRCLKKGLFGRRHSARAHHALDSDDYAIHVGSELGRRFRCKVEVLGKEKKSGHHDRRRPKHDLVHCHDIKATFRALVGGEISEYVKLMAEAREQSVDRMIEAAEQLGANAVVATRFTTSMVMQGAAELLATGTAVIVEDE